MFPNLFFLYTLSKIFWERHPTQYLNCMGDAYLPSRVDVPPSKFNVPTIKVLASLPTKIQRPTLQEKVAGSINLSPNSGPRKYQIAAETFFCLLSNLEAKSVPTEENLKFFLNSGQNFCRIPNLSGHGCAIVHPCNILQFKCCTHDRIQTH